MLPASLAGYAARAGLAQGVHDALHVRALVISDAAVMVCLIVCEVVCVDLELTTRIREQVAAALDMPHDHILVAATHTHSGPVGLTRTPALPGAVAYMGHYDTVTADTWVAVCIRAAQIAYAARQPARAIVGSVSAEGVACNRNHPDGEVDTDVPWLAFLRTDGAVTGCIYSIACHPTVLGADNLLYSADLTGAICTQLETKWHGAIVIGLTGAAGDVSTRFTRRSATLAEMERLAALVSTRFDLTGGHPLTSAGVMAARTFTRLKLKQTIDRDRLLQRQAQVQSQIASATSEQAIAPLQTEALGIRIALNSASGTQTDVLTEVQALRIGEVLILAFPGEMFVDYGLRIRAVCFPMPVLVAGYANDYVGYFPTDTTDNGYERVIAVVAPGAGDQLMDTALLLARGLFVSHTRAHSDENVHKEAL
jgi:hypothetical protein